MSTKTSMPSSSEGAAVRSVENQDQQLSLPLPGVTAALVDDPEKAFKKAYLRQWHKDHPEASKKYYKTYWAKHGASVKAKRNTPEGKQKQREINRASWIKHKPKRQAYNRNYYLNNKPKLDEYKKSYAPRRRELYLENREKILARKKEISHRYLLRIQEYNYRRRRTDIQYALKDRLRATMNRALKRQWVEKSMRTMELIGCSVEDLKAYLSAQFVNGMSWENKGTWHVDHFVPLSAFDLRDVEEQKVAFNWKNLRPIPCHENHAKSDKIPDPLPSWLPEWMVQRLEERKTAQGFPRAVCVVTMRCPNSPSLNGPKRQSHPRNSSASSPLDAFHYPPPVRSPCSLPKRFPVP